MAGDRSAVRVVRGHPWTQTTLSEVAPGFSSPVSAVTSAVEWFRSTRASRGSLGSTSWNWDGWSVRSTKQSTVPSRSCNLCGSPRGHWTRSHRASDGFEESEAGRTRATSGCPDEFVRAFRHQSTTAFDGARRGEDPSATTAKEVPVPPCVIQPKCGGHIAHLEEMVRTLQDELKATRAASCGVLPLPDSLGDLSTLIEVKTRELTNAVPIRWREGRQIVIRLGNHWEQDQHGPARCDQRRQQTEGAVPVRYVRGRVHVAQCTGEGRFAPY